MKPKTSKVNPIRGFVVPKDEVDLSTVSDEAFNAEVARRRKIADDLRIKAAEAIAKAHRDRTWYIWKHRKALLKFAEHSGSCTDKDPHDGFDPEDGLPDHYPAQKCLRCVLLTLSEEHIDLGVFDLHLDSTIHVTARFDK